MKKPPKLPPLWMGLVLDKPAQTLHVAAFNESKEGAEKSAREQFPEEMPVVCVNIVGGAGAMINRISLWLAENDIVGVENTDLVRKIAKSLKETLEDIERESKERPRPTGPKRLL